MLRGFHDVILWLQGHDSAEAKEIAAILAEEKVELVPEEDKEKLHELDSLTGQPRPDDILLYAIPVRADFDTALQFLLHRFCRFVKWEVEVLEALAGDPFS